MPLWGFRWFKLFLNPFKNDDFEHISESDRRLYILGQLEDAEPSEWSWVVVVAGVGFFTDAYSIFAINMVIPMLGIIYYGGEMPRKCETALSVVTLGGSIIGQVAFGFAADIWGRRKMYGLELIITIAATLGCVMASNGTESSMSLIVWLLVWRFFLGIGIGADYPLSAVICSEFAPTRLRGKMLTAVFMCQPLGQLAATLVTLIVVASQHNGIPTDAMPNHCNAKCLKTMDSTWRWIIGVGVIPAVIALWFRLTIIESPRYTADVGRDSRKAASELQQYLLLQARAQIGAGSSTSINIAGLDSNSLPLRRPASGLASNNSGEEQRISGNFSEDGNQREFATNSYQPSIVSQQNESIDLEAPEGSVPPPEPSWEEFKQYFWMNGNLRTLIATSFCWMALDLPFYGLGMSSPHTITTIWYGKSQPDLSIYDLIIHDVWQSLVVVSLGAMVGCLITLFTIDKLGRKNIQMNGFFWLFILFVVIGGSFNHLYETGGNAAIIVLYILCQIFFNFGPNTTTYIMPAELFPTRYRGLSHGISAAFGKLGSVIAQLFLAYIDYGHGVDHKVIQKWLPYSLLIFSVFMLLGLLVTWKWIPGQEHGPDGTIKTLEQWEVGRNTPNGFAQTKFARATRKIWKILAHVVEAIYLYLDKLAGGDGKELREEARRNQTEMSEVGREVNGEDVRDMNGDNRPK